MIKLTNIHLHGVVTYKNASLKLNKYPLVRVSGENHDRKVAKASNGSGKSLLFTTLGSVLLNFVRSHATKSEKNTILSSKESYATVSLEKNGDKYKITQYFKGTTRWKIEKNGVAEKFRKPSEELEYIRTKVFNIGEQQFYSQVVVDGRSKTLLQAGSSKQRFDYFEDIFKLKAYDLLATLVIKDCNRLRLLNQEFEVLTKELGEKQSELPNNNKKELLAKKVEVQGKFNKIRENIDGLLNELHITKTFITVGESDYLHLSLEQLQNELIEVETEEGKINELHEKAIVFAEQQKAKKETEEKRKEIIDKLKTLPESDLTVEELEEKTSSLALRINKKQDWLAQEYDAVQHNEIIYKQLENLKKDDKKFITKYETTSIITIQKTLSNNKAERKNLVESAQALEEHQKLINTMIIPLVQRAYEN